jgi:hypothetical protein
MRRGHLGLVSLGLVLALVRGFLVLVLGFLVVVVVVSVVVRVVRVLVRVRVLTPPKAMNPETTMMRP